MQNLNKAKEILINQGKCCVVLKENDCFTSTEFGIKPLMICLRQNKNYFENAVVADKVIGKAAALLLVLGKVTACYGSVISKLAIDVLEKYNIYFEYGELVDNIQNRTKDGICPMEMTVIGIDDPSVAFDALEGKIAELMAKK